MAKRKLSVQPPSTADAIGGLNKTTVGEEVKATTTEQENKAGSSAVDVKQAAEGKEATTAAANTNDTKNPVRRASKGQRRGKGELSLEVLKNKNTERLSGLTKNIATDANIHVTLQKLSKDMGMPLSLLTNNLWLFLFDKYGEDLKQISTEAGEGKSVDVRSLL